MLLFKLLLMVGLWLPLLAGEDAVTFNDVERGHILQHAMQPLPPDAGNRVADAPAAARLGQYLFFETRFSANGLVACATCHKPELGFSDGLQRSRGLGVVRRHAQTLWNAAYQRWFFWDGRADSLWAQALAPLEDPLEIGGNRLAIAHAVYADPDLRGAYISIFGPMPDLADRLRFPLKGKPVGNGHEEWLKMTEADRHLIDVLFANLGKAIAAYERRLVTPDSPFDRFVAALKKGEPVAETAYPDAARRGLKLFIGKGRCRLCHSGPVFSDGQFHNTGVPPLQGSLPRDPGRYEGIPQVLANPFNGAGDFSDTSEAGDMVRFLRRQPENWGQFKTPGLRNVVQTAPYMHQGQFASLEEVVAFYATLERQVRMGHHRDTLLVPLDLSGQERRDLIAFLKSLTADPPDTQLLRQPDSPR